jgi:uncharacterized protein (DUF1499 family)
MARLARWLAAFALMLLLVAAAAHRFDLLETPDLLSVLTLDMLIALLALVAAGIAFARFWNDGEPVGRDIAVATVLAIAALSPALCAAALSATRPMLNDISTDTANPPTMLEAARRRGSDMNPVLPISPSHAVLQAQAYPAVVGHRYVLPFDEAREAVMDAIAAAGWSAMPAVETGAGEVTIEATARTLVFGFPNDVAIRITDEDGTVFVDMRSSSRYGQHDLGDNAARILSFYQHLDAAVRSRM